MFSHIYTKFNAFCEDEDGLALTEYLILLGLLTAVVIGAVTAFGVSLGNGWQAWADWLGGQNLAPPSSGGT
ncbi:hypothetical protein MGEO_19120 [Marivita geojedonensis]|uniref:Flp family type IVb pilin n=2 Tax=Marivita geojedonensis TaxID=1123756 RepID=A0A1X4NCL3_9RHOB|nr:hypothetical protein MGEO_19120 [Marivita geojedonensis]